MKSCNIRRKKWIFGDTYTTSSHKPDKNKVTAITKMPVPEASTILYCDDLLLVKIFCQIVRDCGAHPGVGKEESTFQLGPRTSICFYPDEARIVSAPILAYYNPKKQIVFQTDAGIKGLGTCLLQDEKPVYFASKALMEAQQVYVAIELESLAVVWAMEKFHHFLYASHFIWKLIRSP